MAPLKKEEVRMRASGELRLGDDGGVKGTFDLDIDKGVWHPGPGMHW